MTSSPRIALILSVLSLFFTSSAKKCGVQVVAIEQIKYKPIPVEIMEKKPYRSPYPATTTTKTTDMTELIKGMMDMYNNPPPAPAPYPPPAPPPKPVPPSKPPPPPPIYMMPAPAPAPAPIMYPVPVPMPMMPGYKPMPMPMMPAYPKPMPMKKMPKMNMMPYPVTPVVPQYMPPAQMEVSMTPNGYQVAGKPTPVTFENPEYGTQKGMAEEAMDDPHGSIELDEEGGEEESRDSAVEREGPTYGYRIPNYASGGGNQQSTSAGGITFGDLLLASQFNKQRKQYEPQSNFERRSEGNQGIRSKNLEEMSHDKRREGIQVQNSHETESGRNKHFTSITPSSLFPKFSIFDFQKKERNKRG